MKKFKVGFSTVLVVVLCLIFKRFLLLINYLFALFLHEMAHLYVATKKGYKLKFIKLNMFGFSVELKETIDERDAFDINLAGPIFNMSLCIVCLAVYWLVPASFTILNNFCTANLVLALFNLLPIYPLDGGKIFQGIFKKNRTYKRVDLGLRIFLAIVFGGLFVASLSIKPNFFCLLMAVFFAMCRAKQTPSFSLFKTDVSNKNLHKVEIIKLSEKCTLFEALKQIKKTKYTIFYFPHCSRCLDEDKLMALALNYPLTSLLGALVENENKGSLMNFTQ